MSVSNTLDHQVHRAAFWSTAIVVATGIAAFFLPLDAPGGYEATPAERVRWLMANSGPFVLGWFNQIVAMIALSGVLAGIAWKIAETHPLRAILAAAVVAMSMVVFFIPKFIAVWTIPMLAQSLATDAATSGMAETLLPILNVTVPFSLYTSFDYLGFWLYSSFALLVAGPLLRGSLAEKIVGATLASFAVAYNGVVGAVLTRAVAAPEIEAWALGVFGLLALVTIPSFFLFRRAPTGVQA